MKTRRASLRLARFRSRALKNSPNNGLIFEGMLQ